MKFLTYGYDSCGLGHLRRTLQIGRHLAELLPDSAVLSVIGSTFGQNFFSASAANHDFIKLPSAAKVDTNQYEARHLPIPYSELIEMRRSILIEVVAHFGPDVVIIDKNPRGLGGRRHTARHTYPRSGVPIGLSGVKGFSVPGGVQGGAVPTLRLRRSVVAAYGVGDSATPLGLGPSPPSRTGDPTLTSENFWGKIPLQHQALY